MLPSFEDEAFGFPDCERALVRGWSLELGAARQHREEVMCSMGLGLGGRSSVKKNEVGQCDSHALRFLETAFGKKVPQLGKDSNRD